MYELNGKDLCGERIILEFSRRGPRGRGMYDRYPPPRRESRPVACVVPPDMTQCRGSNGVKSIIAVARKFI